MNRSDWLRWRHDGIGSSDSPVVMGVSPYKDRTQLLYEKAQPEPPPEVTSWIMEKGNELEPVARNKFAAEYSIENGVDEIFAPRLYHLEDLPYMKASLDGVSFDGKAFIEIKYVGDKEFALDSVPERYVPQVQKQFLCSGCEEGWLVKINKRKQINKIRVYPNKEMQKFLIEIETTFWLEILKEREIYARIRSS